MTRPALGRRPDQRLITLRPALGQEPSTSPGRANPDRLGDLQADADAGQGSAFRPVGSPATGTGPSGFGRAIRPPPQRADRKPGPGRRAGRRPLLSDRPRFPGFPQGPGPPRSMGRRSPDDSRTATSIWVRSVEGQVVATTRGESPDDPQPASVRASRAMQNEPNLRPRSSRRNEPNRPTNPDDETNPIARRPGRASSSLHLQRLATKRTQSPDEPRRRNEPNRPTSPDAETNPTALRVGRASSEPHHARPVGAPEARPTLRKTPIIGNFAAMPDLAIPVEAGAPRRNEPNRVRAQWPASLKIIVPSLPVVR